MVGSVWGLGGGHALKNILLTFIGYFDKLAISERPHHAKVPIFVPSCKKFVPVDALGMTNAFCFWESR
jgi:hypothetical protein